MQQKPVSSTSMRRSPFSSIAVLVVLGFVATAMPLVVALVSGSIQVNNLTHQSERAMVQAVSRARFSEVVADELVSMERNARQYQLLGEPQLLALYDQRKENLLAALDQLANTDPEPSSVAQIRSIRRNVAALSAALQDQRATGVEGGDPFDELHGLAASLQQASDASVKAQLRTLSVRSQQVQGAFLRQSTLLALFGLLLATLFVVAILRPLRQINRAISRLGAEDYETPIMIDGPRDLEQVGARLEWLRLRLQDVERQKNEFVRHMSHELKTPLANIRQSASMLLDDTVERLTASQREIVTIVDNSGRRLHRLVDNLINLARWREQRALSLSEFDFAALIDHQVNEHRLLMERKDLRLELTRPDVLPVTADYERVATLVANLLSNAIKFSPARGRILVSVELSCDVVVLEVGDEGPGIPLGEQEAVFAPFVQGSQTVGAYEGTGIGLSLVSECLAVHRGSGEFLPVDTGTRFQARLPIAGEMP